MFGTLSSLGGDKRGQALVEYALIILLVAVAAIAALARFGHTTSSVLNNASALIPH